MAAPKCWWMPISTAPQVKRLAANIYRASRRIQELLQDLLNVSRGSARGAEVCKLRDVAAAGCESLLASAEAQRVEVQIGIPDEIELPLERNRMERVFSNLVGNALEMMPDGGRDPHLGRVPKTASSSPTCATPAPASPRRSAIASSNPSSAPAKRTASASAWPSPAKPSSTTAATCGPNPNPATAPASAFASL